MNFNLYHQADRYLDRFLYNYFVQKEMLWYLILHTTFLNCMRIQQFVIRPHLSIDALLLMIIEPSYNELSFQGLPTHLHKSVHKVTAMQLMNFHINCFFFTKYL